LIDVVVIVFWIVWMTRPTVPLDPNRVASPAYVAEIVCVPDADAAGANETEQLADAPEPANMHVAFPPNAPGPLLEKLTSPDGGPAASVTVAVHTAV
jgi:hypothetical protein